MEGRRLIYGFLIYRGIYILKKEIVCVKIGKKIERGKDRYREIEFKLTNFKI